MIMGTVVYWLSGGDDHVVVGGLLGMKESRSAAGIAKLRIARYAIHDCHRALLLPWSSGRYARTGTSSFKRTIRVVNSLFVLLAVAYVAGLLLAGRWLLNLLYKGNYSQVAYLLPLVALPLLLSAASQGTAMALRAMQAPADVFWGYAGGGAMTIIVGVALTHVWGLAGALVGLSASSLLFFAIITVLYRRRMKKSVESCSP